MWVELIRFVWAEGGEAMRKLRCFPNFLFFRGPQRTGSRHKDEWPHPRSRLSADELFESWLFFCLFLELQWCWGSGSNDLKRTASPIVNTSFRRPVKKKKKKYSSLFLLVKIISLILFFSILFHWSASDQRCSYQIKRYTRIFLKTSPKCELFHVLLLTRDALYSCAGGSPSMSFFSL